ncbi:MAG: hypothetical protein M1542_08300 [Thermotogae bacterium]|jgi:hypothetical protein|nr:hypothetical protein [Thermotogota bacterium]MCL5033228.1 hypothetical protein [Thermotogota bacterium]
MGKFKKVSIVFLVIGVVVTAFVLSSCTVNVTPPPTPSPQTYNLYEDQPTGNLNCAGWTITGMYCYVEFSLLNSGSFEVTAWSNSLPPSNFDVLIMSTTQYDNFAANYESGWEAGQMNFSDLYGWDMTTAPSLNGYQYYLDETENLAAGNYYLVFFNNYEQFGAGYYGAATFNLSVTY